MAAPTPDNFFPITDREADALHAMGWSSGYGWATDFDWYHEPSSGPRIWTSDDAEWRSRFISDVEGIRRTEATRLRKERLHAAAEQMYETLDLCQRVLAVLLNPANAEVSNKLVWANCVAAESRARAALKLAREG